ncbi:MAG: DUF1778 domain-containing protein [Chloroflexota bacterium]|nr:DUF1778 domain-containing protein [Chloroflexota bacterium]
MSTEANERTKTPRFNIRMPEHVRVLIDQAAALEGRSTSDFVLTSAVEKARATIESHERIVLSREESIAFAELLLNPPKASDNLRAAIADYLEFFGGPPRGE